MRLEGRDETCLAHLAKPRKRDDAARQADANRARHGETKAARQLREAEAARAARRRAERVVKLLGRQRRRRNVLEPEQVAQLIAVAINRDAYLHDLERELTARVRELAEQDHLGERILNQPLDRAFQRARAIGRIVPLVGQEPPRLVDLKGISGLADIKVEIKPLPRGSGVKFSDTIVGGVVKLRKRLNWFAPGAAAAALHFAGALKSMPGLAALPFDLTLAALGLALLLLLLFGHRLAELLHSVAQGLEGR